MVKVHGLLPILPGDRTKEEWVRDQLYGLAQRYAEAKLAGDKERITHLWNTLTVLQHYHKELITPERLADVTQDKIEAVAKASEAAAAAAKALAKPRRR